MKSKVHKEWALPESRILLPRDPSLDEDTDAWPEFDLTEVKVYKPGDPEARVSLLEASASSPLTLRGQLAPLNEDQRHLYRLSKPSKRRTNVELSDVRTFSYGQFGDGSIAIWAAGEAGWYIIRPCSAYKSIYDDMVDAVKTFYFVADSYREVTGTARGKKAAMVEAENVTSLFTRCAKQMCPGAPKPAKGEARINRHRKFILSSMLAGKEGIHWIQTPLFEYLSRTWPELHTELSQAPVHVEAISSQQQQKGHKRKRNPEDRPEEKSRLSPSKSTKSASSGSSTAPSQIPARVPKPSSSRARTSAQQQQPAGGRAKTPSQEDESDDEIPSRHKSGLRLQSRAGKFLKSSNTGKQPLIATEAAESSDSPSSPSEDPRRNRKLPTEPSRTKTRPQRNSRLHPDEGIDIPTSPSSVAHSDPSPLDDDDAAAATFARNTHHRPDPVQEDTWACALDGCTHKVYGASAAEAQHLIREHYALHAYDDDERVQLVKKLQAPSLPAGRLMDRIREQAKLEGFPGSRVAGTRYPTVVPAMAAVTAGVVQKY